MLEDTERLYGNLCILVTQKEDNGIQIFLELNLIQILESITL